MRLPVTAPIGALPKAHQPLQITLGRLWSRIVASVNSGIEFGSPQSQSKGLPGNIAGTWPGVLASGYTITTPGVANTEFTVVHNLGRIPIGYDVKSISAAAHIYDSRKNAWTTTQMFLKCDQPSVNLVLFVH